MTVWRMNRAMNVGRSGWCSPTESTKSWNSYKRETESQKRRRKNKPWFSSGAVELCNLFKCNFRSCVTLVCIWSDFMQLLWDLGIGLAAEQFTGNRDDWTNFGLITYVHPWLLISNHATSGHQQSTNPLMPSGAIVLNNDLSVISVICLNNWSFQSWKDSV